MIYCRSKLAYNGYRLTFFLGVRSSGFGKHVQQISAQNIRDFWLFLYLSEIIYPISIAVTKISMLLFYWRLFQVASFKISVVVVGVVVAAWAFATVCHPSHFKSRPKLNHIDACCSIVM